jgi:hypothetical protein
MDPAAMKEPAMPGSDDRDTVVDQPDRWSPGGAPPAEGWYDDPWNAEFLRRWDGSQWTGETIRKGEIPPPTGDVDPAPPHEPAPGYDAAPGHEPPPAYSTPAYGSDYEEVWTPTDDPDPDHGPGAPAAATWPPKIPPAAGPAGAAPTPPAPPAPPIAPPLWRQVPKPVLAGIGAAVAVVVAVVVLSGHGHSTAASSSLPPAPATTALVTGLPDGVLSASDLGPGWTPSPPAHPLTVADYTHGPCGSPLWTRDVAGYLSSFVNGASAAAARGAVVSRTVKAPSLAVANQQQTVITDLAYGDCLKHTVTAQVQSQLPPGQSVTATAVTPFSLQLPVTNVAYVVTVTVTGPGGATREVTDNSVTMMSGRYLSTVDVSWSSDAPLAATIVQEQASDEAARLESLG